jgi:hypothetical protein
MVHDITAHATELTPQGVGGPGVRGRVLAGRAVVGLLVPLDHEAGHGDGAAQGNVGLAHQHD